MSRASMPSGHASCRIMKQQSTIRKQTRLPWEGRPQPCRHPSQTNRQVSNTQAHLASGCLLVDTATMHASLAALQPYLDQPLIQLLIFLLASSLMIWRLNALERKGFAGTLIGTLIMPYCSGAANLAFVWAMARSPTATSNGTLVVENAIVNNLTNLALLLGLTAALWVTRSPTASAGKMSRARQTRQSAAPAERLQRLELLFTLTALLLFTGTLWALGADGRLDRHDGLVLVGLFLFWQVLHVFEVLKHNVRHNQRLKPSLFFDLLLIALATWGVCSSMDALVGWVETAQHDWINTSQLGWLSGLLGVLPNALLAGYYAHQGRQDIVVSSQVGDAHICIPLCVGLYALFLPITPPAYFSVALLLIAAAALLHFLCQAFIGRLPAILGWILAGAYAGFMYAGVLQGAASP